MNRKSSKSYDYGEYCPLAKASQVLCERWTLLIVRELFAGCCRFSEFQRYLPRISPSLLKARLTLLEDHGLITRTQLSGRKGHEYRLTAAGQGLESVLATLGAWSLRWIYDGMSDDQLKVDILMRDVQLCIVKDRLPASRSVLEFRFNDLTQSNRWYVVVDRGEAQLCDDLALESDVRFVTDVRSLSEVWMGDLSLRDAEDSGRLRIDGQPSYLRTLPSWIGLSPYAALPRRGAR